MIFKTVTCAFLFFQTLEVPQHVTNSLQSLESEIMSGPLVRSGSSFIRIAGLSGAAAVALGAYGAHCKTKN